MLILDNSILKDENSNNYIALGSFDGFHKGHLELVHKVKEEAVKHNGKSIIFTFKNHPKEFIFKEDVLDLLMTNDEKINVLENEGIDILAFQDFNEEMMKMEPEEFIKKICHGFKIKGIVVGFNFKFGYKNTGDIEDLKKYQEKYNYELHVIEPYIYGEEPVSSTRIRKSLNQGDVLKAFKMLSRPYSLKGEIVHGRKIGRTIGFPTANIKVEGNKMIPKIGVYYTNIQIDGIIFKGITSIGHNPTVNWKELTIETYILNFCQNIYGKKVQLFFIEKIRDEIKFNGLDQLVEQLNKDKSFAHNNIFIISKDMCI